MRRRMKKFFTKSNDAEAKRIQDQMTDRRASLYNMMF